MAAPQPSRAGGMSLYANLLDENNADSSSSASISRAPVVSQEALEAAKEQAAKKASDPALRFQPFNPIRRPQQNKKPKTGFPKAIPGGPPPAAVATTQSSAAPEQASAPTTSTSAETAAGPGSTPAKTKLSDWAPREEDEWMYGTGEKRQRGGRRRKKKKFDDGPMETDWDEIYDPSRPTNVEEYLRSDERIREVHEWKALLYRHRKPQDKRRSSYDSDLSDEEEEERRPMNNQFAPPGSYSFAPPPMSPKRESAPVPDDSTGDDAYARRVAMSQGNAAAPPPPPPPAMENVQTSPPPPPDPSTISRAPVRYQQEPETAPDHDAMDEGEDEEYIPPPPVTEAGAPDVTEEEPRSMRPGQAGFAQRLMAKYGWSKGQGLGASSSGIAQPLRVQVEKRKKKSDAEGGGWAGPGGRGKIIGAKQGKPSTSSNPSESEGFGKMSNVIVLRNMLEGMPDLREEIEQGLGQEIGEECGEKYGRVERLYIDVEGRQVFIKFTDGVSALRAVNALNGRIFNGNAIEPGFYDEDMFEKGVYRS